MSDSQTNQALTGATNNALAKAFAKLQAKSHEDPAAPAASKASRQEPQVVEERSEPEVPASSPSFSQPMDKTSTVEQKPAASEPSISASDFFKLQETMKKAQDAEARAAALEARAKKAEDEARRYQDLINNAPDDPLSLMETAKLDQNSLLEAMANGGKAPVNRGQLRKVESSYQTLSQELQALKQQLAERDAQAQRQTLTSQISAHLQSKPEYGILKAIPDAPSAILAEMDRIKQDARNRGEAVPEVSVEKAAGLLRQRFVELVKQAAADDMVRKELESSWGNVSSESSKVSRPRKGITSGMSASGNTGRTTKGYDKNDRLKKAMSLITKR